MENMGGALPSLVVTAACLLLLVRDPEWRMPWRRKGCSEVERCGVWWAGARVQSGLAT